MNTKEEIRLIIQKNLPAEVGQVLKERLEQAERNEDENKVLRDKLQYMNKREKELITEIENYKKSDDRNSKLDERERELEIKMRDFELSKLKYEITAEKEKAQFCKDVALGLVRNTEYRKHILDSENQSGYMGPNGVYIYPTPVCKEFTETKSAQ